MKEHETSIFLRPKATSPSSTVKLHLFVSLSHAQNLWNLQPFPHIPELFVVSCETRPAPDQHCWWFFQTELCQTLASRWLHVCDDQPEQAIAKQVCGSTLPLHRDMNLLLAILHLFSTSICQSYKAIVLQFKAYFTLFLWAGIEPVLLKTCFRLNCER